MRPLGFKSGVHSWSWRGIAGTAALVALTACGTTVDSLGSDLAPSDGGSRILSLRPLTRRSSYPNALRDVLGKSDAEIRDKINGAFDQLFHGNPDSEAIYVPVGSDQALIRDFLHNDVRTEGLGYAMMIAVQLDKQDEFDKIWRYAKTVARVQSGPNEGYFLSDCDQLVGTAPCYDPFGLEQMTMALIFAHDRWERSTPPATDAGAEAEAGPSMEAGSRTDGATADAAAGRDAAANRDAAAMRDATGASAADAADGAAVSEGGSANIDYESDAIDLLEVMRHKEDQNGGVVMGVTNVFDATSKLVFDEPNTLSANTGRPSVEMPAYYELWLQATGDSFWADAAANARTYWHAAANATTGFLPVRATFDGAPVLGSDIFAQEVYRTQLSMALDEIWSARDPWDVDEANHLLGFFYGKAFCRSYTLDGSKCLDTTYDEALIAMNGASSLVATDPNRAFFMGGVWDMETPTGPGRYYSGLLDLLGLLLLSGEYQVY